MQDTKKPAIKMNFLGEYVKRIEFNIHKSRYALSKTPEAVPQTEFQLIPKYIALADDEYEVGLEVIIKAFVATSKEEIFNLTLEYCGIFKFDGTIMPEVVEAALLVDGVTLLFPFCRQEVARVILSSGFPAIMLEPMDFRRLYGEYKTKSVMHPENRTVY